MQTRSEKLGMVEFVILLAMMISILALSIDAILPALNAIGKDLKLANENDAQLVVSAMFLGFAIGQILVGPLSDSFGRKPVVYVGYGIFIAGCVMSLVAESFAVMLVGRVLQGLGAAAPRIVTVALVRDIYEGRVMARIMSIVMAVFILVPAIAPAIGQGILLIAHWRMIFALFLATALVALMWFALRQPETLLPEKRRAFSLANVLRGIGEVFNMRAVTGYTIAAGIVFGAFLGYLSSAQQVFQTVYKTGDWFAVYFGAAALAIGAASFINARLVVRLGMRYMTWRAMIAMVLVSVVAVPVVQVNNGVPQFWLFMSWLLAAFFCVGVLFGNLNALAMEPVGHLAGLGAAVFGSLSTVISLPLGWFIGHRFDGTVMPLIAGFAILGTVSLAVMWWTERGLEGA